MCGILAALGLTGDAEKNRRRVLRASRLLRHRGPDSSGVYEDPQGGRAFISFERLNIVDPTDGGRQPFQIVRPEGNLAWALNSEIYNHKELVARQLPGVHIPSGSDSAIIGYLMREHGDTNELWNSLDGIFACVVWDEATGEFTIARDPIGICSLYWGRDAAGAVWVASEMKALQHLETLEIFPPGHVFRSRTGALERYFQPDWLDVKRVPTTPVDLPALKAAFESAVIKRLMSDAPLGILLSGGLDSSLVASVATRYIRSPDSGFARDHPVHTFSIGVRGSPDLAAARRVADFLGTTHHEFTFTVQEGIDALEDLIWHIESVEQVRSAVPMYLLARRIKALGIKVVLSGEGADEVFGGYLYFHKAPSAAEFQAETVRLIDRLHQWDVMRANKAPFSFGVETRVPFLDKSLLALAMNIDPRDKMIDRAASPPRLEKFILRKAFDCPEAPYLPLDVLWRQKEQFSDGVGYDWVDGIKLYAEAVVPDELWAKRAERWPEHTPRTREYYLLRSIFDAHFKHPQAFETVPKGLSIACSTPEALAWDPDWANVHEISGRAIASVHDHAAAHGFDFDKPVVVDGLIRGD